LNRITAGDCSTAGVDDVVEGTSVAGGVVENGSDIQFSF
jgi:hypothetical protein